MKDFFIETAKTLVLALLVFLAMRASIQNFRVEGPSMEPTLHGGSYVLVNKLFYLRIPVGRLFGWLPFVDTERDSVAHPFRTPKRGDIVVFRFYRNAELEFVKRVIGEPGDTVEIRSGRVYVNGKLLEEPYRTIPGDGADLRPVAVPPDSYFVLGDNRTASNDSRAFGPVHESTIIGRAWVAYWPVSELALLRSPKVAAR
jgi:signal peptidase I